MSKIAIIGAGALGRGAIAPLLLRAKHQVVFFDNNQGVVRKLQHPTHVMLFGQGVTNYAYVVPTYTNNKFEARDFDLVITCTRPMAPPELWQTLAASNVPVVMLENSIAIPGLYCANLYPGVADILSYQANVCFSEDASAGIGRICVDTRVRKILGEVAGFHYFTGEDLRKLWAARFITHNTGHAVLAYLGASEGYHTMAQAAENKVIATQACGAMLEAGYALDHHPGFRRGLGIEGTGALRDFWWHYYQTEIDRYRNFAPDTIERVARDPQRKLAYSERLLGPARAYYEAKGELPLSLIFGINAAIKYARYEVNYALDQICELEKSSPLYPVIKEYHEAQSRVLIGTAR